MPRTINPNTVARQWALGRNAGGPRGVAARLLGGLFLLGVCCAAITLQSLAPDSAAAGRIQSQGMYNVTNVCTVHLTFAPDQWEAMEPKGGFGGFGGGPGGFGGGLGGPGGAPGEPGRSPGGPGEPGGFGPGMFIAPAIMRQSDLNHDGRLSREEFVTLSGKWFAAWDTNKTGKLDIGKIRAGLNTTLDQPGGGPGARPGGPGNRGPGMMLQGPEGKRNGLASAMGTEFAFVHADLEIEGHRFQDVGVRYKGNGTFMESRGSLKRSLKVDLSKYVNNPRLGGVRILNLHNNITDASWMNEVLAYRLYRDAGIPAPRTAYARVYVTVPGKFDRKYFGLYSLVENVDKHFTERTFGTKRGAILKPVTPALFADLGPDWSKYKQTYDPKSPLFDEQIQTVMGLCRLVTGADDAQFAARIGDYLDVPEFARFMAVMVWLSDMDGILGPGQNLFLYLHPKSQLFEFIPWDQDHSFGQFPMRGTQEQRENLSIHKPWEGENRFLERVFKVEAFKKAYLADLKEMGRTLFNPARFSNQVNEISVAIQPAVLEESEEKLARLDKVVAGQSVAGGGFGPFGGAGTKPIKPFAAIRTRSVLEQLAGTSKGMVIGGMGFPGGGPGGPPRGPGGPGGFGPGMFLGNTFLEALDTEKHSLVTRDEFTQGFVRWFEAWNSDKSGALTEEQLRAGINKDLSPFRNGSPQGFGPPLGFQPPVAPDDE